MTAPGEQIKFLNFPEAGTRVQEGLPFPLFSIYVSPDYTGGPIEILFMRKYTVGGRRGTTVYTQQLGPALATIPTPGLYESPSQVSITLPLIKSITGLSPVPAPVSPGVWGTSFFFQARSVSDPTIFINSPLFIIEVAPDINFIYIKTPRAGQIYTAGENITIEWENTWKNRGVDLAAKTGTDDPQVTFDIGVGGPSGWLSFGTIGTASVNAGTFTGKLPSPLDSRGDYMIRAQIANAGDDYGTFFVITAITTLIERTGSLTQQSKSLSQQLDSLLGAASPASPVSATPAPNITTTTTTKGGRRQTRKRKQKKRGSRRR